MLCVAIARLRPARPTRKAPRVINVTQTLALTDKLLARGIYVLFLSTNQVFDGRDTARARPMRPIRR